MLRAVDAIILANIFPYYENAATLDSAIDSFRTNAQTALTTVDIYGKDLWLGETGWPYDDTTIAGRNPNNVANAENAKQYFNKIGCRILKGYGSSFYYVDWDEDGAYDKPHFGILDSRGEAKNGIDAYCTGYTVDKSVASSVPRFAGGLSPP